ncbi:putative transmembrane protein [Gregarina niphandrodes]|uniref:Transmembrane protein n=1 Tax=Gregarina niphandrodes TaxID=110365 RepID=A0A023B8F1_GRENI|nr:putative transmembrane protein [Gregarina niphandrodes]EZG68904.1 putative transmembrane protein [Gregarina niphandrodes]|eukprot:XP_011134528.1 putative transmembrane protein [Gregarina niphandrodes]
MLGVIAGPAVVTTVDHCFIAIIDLTPLTKPHTEPEIVKMPSPWRGTYVSMKFRRLWYSASVVSEVSLLTCAWMMFYYWSLKGGDLEVIKKIMARLGAYLLLSILISSYNMWRILLTPTRSLRKRVEFDTSRGSPLRRVWSRLLRSRSSLIPLDTESPRNNSEASEARLDVRYATERGDPFFVSHDDISREDMSRVDMSREGSYNELEYLDEASSVIQQSPLPRGGIASNSTRLNASEPRRLYKYRSGPSFDEKQDFVDLYMSGYTKGHRNGLLLLNVAALLFLALYDRGVDFEHHGSFNLLIFLILFVPINVIVGAVILWYRSMSTRLFLQSFASVLTLILVVVGLRLHIMKQRSQVGFFGQTILRDDELCEIPVATPYFDVLPQRAQTFWTGRTSCPAVPSPRATASGFFAKIDFTIDLTNDGWLKMDCPGGRAEFTFTPDTRYWTKREKLSQPLGNSLQDNVVKFMQDHRQPYIPTDDNKGMYVGGLAKGPLARGEDLTGASRTPDTVVGYCNGVSRMATAIPDRPDVEAKLSFWDAHLRAQQQEQGERRLDDGRFMDDESAADAEHRQRQRRRSQRDLPPNILILFIDAVGRKQFFRRLTQTKAALEGMDWEATMSRSLADVSSSNLYQFFRYHSVGFNTGPNTQALFTGVERDYDRYYPPIWSILKNRGRYVTGVVQGHCEDWNVLYQEHLNETKISDGRVLVTPDVDYELESMACFPEYEPVKWTDRGNFQGYTSIVRRCLWGRHVHEWELDYSRKFIQKFQNKSPWFLVTTLMEGHEGTGEVISQVDRALASFLTNDVPRDNTVLLLVSDHGLHMGLNFLYFLDGRINHRTPFGAMLLSRDLLNKVAQNENTNNDQSIDADVINQTLVTNQQRLVTAADMYFTLRHIAQRGFNWSSLQANSHHQHDDRGEGQIGWPDKGFNLHNDPDIRIPRRGQLSLLELVPANRTCATAGIPSETCVCS